MGIKIQIRRGSAAQWTAANTLLASGEQGYETDTGKRKIGDGVTEWADLPYDFSQDEADNLYATNAIVPTTRSFSARGGPTSPYLAPSAFAIPQDFGGVGDGLSDDTTALQDLFTAMGDEPHAAGMILPGQWTTMSPITAAANSTIVGERGRSVITAGLTGWSGGSKRAIIEVVGVDNVTIRDLVLDDQGASRASANATGGLLLINNSRGGLVERVTFRDRGYIGGSSSTAALTMIAKDLITEHTPYDGAVVGSVENWTIRDCHFEMPDTIDGASFGIRVLTDWDAKRPTADFAHYVRNNTIEGCYFFANSDGNGNDWNTIELAGGGTVHNTIRDNHFWGRTLTHIDFDKGASYNTAERNVIHTAGKHPNHVGTPTNTSAPLADHGLPTYLNVGNMFDNNVILESVNTDDPDQNVSGILTQYAHGHVSRGNRVSHIESASGFGTGVYISDNVTDATFDSNVVDAARTGIRTKPSAGIKTNLKIHHNIITGATDAALYVSGTGANQTGLEVVGNQATTSSTTAVAITVGALFVTPLITGNQTSGGEAGITVSGGGAIVAHNVTRNSTRGIRANGSGMRLIGNDMVGTISHILYGITAKPVVEIGNSWNPVISYDTAVPTDGTWKRGDIVYNTTPSAGGTVGWVCTSGGAPGTWKAFGAIDA